MYIHRGQITLLYYDVGTSVQNYTGSCNCSTQLNSSLVENGSREAKTDTAEYIDNKTINTVERTHNDHFPVFIKLSIEPTPSLPPQHFILFADFIP